MEGCVKHMHKVHGFFIPDSQCLTDPRGMPRYLGLKLPRASCVSIVMTNHSKQFESVNAVHKHMEGESHCKLHYGDDGAVEEEIAEFYDFSSSYLTSDGSQIIAMQDGMECHSLAPRGLELIVKGDCGSKTVGSREFAR